MCVCVENRIMPSLHHVIDNDNHYQLINSVVLIVKLPIPGQIRFKIGRDKDLYFVWG